MKKGSRGKEGNLEISKRKKRRSESKGWGQNNGCWKTGVLKRRCFHVRMPQARAESRHHFALVSLQNAPPLTQEATKRQFPPQEW